MGVSRTACSRAISASIAFTFAACSGVGNLDLLLRADGHFLDVGEERGEPVEVAGSVNGSYL